MKQVDKKKYVLEETQIFNGISSFKVPNMNESQMVKKLNGILNTYSDDIDFEIGDAIASAKFLGDIKSKLFGSDDSKEKDETSFINLELKINENNKEMMMIHKALISDEFVGDSLEENAENYLYQKLIESKAISKKKNTIDIKYYYINLME